MRFRLRHILIATALVGSFFGYSAFRRHRILNECELIRKQNVNIELPNQLIDGLWQRPPVAAYINVGIERNRDGLTTMMQRVKAVKKMINNVGVENVFVRSTLHRGRAEGNFTYDAWVAEYEKFLIRLTEYEKR